MQEQLQASFRQAQRQLQQGDAAAALASLAPLLRQAIAAGRVASKGAYRGQTSRGKKGAGLKG